MKYVLCPEIQGKTHKGFIRGGGGGKKLSLKTGLVRQPDIQEHFLFWQRWRKKPRRPCLMCRTTLLLLPPLHSYIIVLYI